MGAEQSLEKRVPASSKGNVEEDQPLSDITAGSCSTSSSSTAKLNTTTTSKNKQITTGSQHGHTSSASPSRRCYTTSTAPNTVQDRSLENSYPFREKVKHLPPVIRKEKYEEEIYRLFRSPHPSHLERLTPVKIQIEKADLPQRRRNTVVTWNESQLTYDIGKGALIQRSYKRCNRSKADPWRRYGALRKLHEIGGTGCTPQNQTGPRVPQKFYRIEAGSVPPPPPTVPPITSIEEYGTIDELIAPKRKKNKTIVHRKTENNHC